MKISTTKPHRGRITNWIKVPCGRELGGLGYRIQGASPDHESAPIGGDVPIITSVVLKHDRRTGRVETLNSVYQLVGQDETSWAELQRRGI